MKLSGGEKIIITMLADIQKALKIKGDLNADRVLASIYGGHLWSLKSDYSGLLHDHEDSEAVVKETCDILDMWSLIERSFASLDDKGKAAVRQANHGSDPSFPGFDGNNDDHYGVARHLIDEMGRFEDFKNRYLNSHSQRMPVYRRMYGAFEPVRGEIGVRPNVAMTADEIASIFIAAYPSRHAAE